jgi:hypothetical protein
VALSRSRKVAAVILIVALALDLGSSAMLAPEADALVSTSMLTKVDGPVLISRAGGDFTSAREGDVLAAGDAIHTGARASAEIIYFDGSSVRLEGDAEIVVTSLRADGGVVQTFGRAWHVITELITGSSRYEVRGPGSTASVRG